MPPPACPETIFSARYAAARNIGKARRRSRRNARCAHIFSPCRWRFSARRGDAIFLRRHEKKAPSCDGVLGLSARGQIPASARRRPAVPSQASRRSRVRSPCRSSRSSTIAGCHPERVEQADAESPVHRCVTQEVHFRRSHHRALSTRHQAGEDGGRLAVRHIDRDVGGPGCARSGKMSRHKRKAPSHDGASGKTGCNTRLVH